jgi:signal peptidase I
MREAVYTRTDDDILPARRRRGGRRARPEAGRPRRSARRPGRHAAPWAPPPPAPPAAPAPLDAATLLGAFDPPPAAPAPALPATAPAGSSPKGARIGVVLAETLLTLTAVLGLVMMTVTVVATSTGMRPLVVRSGSMEPTIPTGSMVLVQRITAAEISVGDIVAVERPDHTRVTHRVVDIERHGETAELTLKGDANEDPDPAPVTVRAADRLVRQMPEVGRVAAWLATAPGGFAVGSVLTAVTMMLLRRRRPDDA